MNTATDATLAKIGKWKFPNDKFIYHKAVLLKQTNALGNTYFSNYIEWQGEAREQLFFAHPAAKTFLGKFPHIMMITHTLHHRFHQNTFAGDVVRIELTTKNVLTHSLMLVFRYYNGATDELVGEGWQKICFFDQLIKQPCKLPEIFLDLAIPLKED